MYRSIEHGLLDANAALQIHTAGDDGWRRDRPR